MQLRANVASAIGAFERAEARYSQIAKRETDSAAHRAARAATVALTEATGRLRREVTEQPANLVEIYRQGRLLERLIHQSAERPAVAALLVTAFLEELKMWSQASVVQGEGVIALAELVSSSGPRPGLGHARRLRSWLHRRFARPAGPATTSKGRPGPSRIDLLFTLLRAETHGLSETYRDLVGLVLPEELIVGVPLDANDLQDALLALASTHRVAAAQAGDAVKRAEHHAVSEAIDVALKLLPEEQTAEFEVRESLARVGRAVMVLAQAEKPKDDALGRARLADAGAELLELSEHSPELGGTREVVRIGAEARDLRRQHLDGITTLMPQSAQERITGYASARRTRIDTLRELRDRAAVLAGLVMQLADSEGSVEGLLAHLNEWLPYLADGWVDAAQRHLLTPATMLAGPRQLDLALRVGALRERVADLQADIPLLPDRQASQALQLHREVDGVANNWAKSTDPSRHNPAKFRYRGGYDRRYSDAGRRTTGT
jgi:hypothetical protein